MSATSWSSMNRPVSAERLRTVPKAPVTPSTLTVRFRPFTRAVSCSLEITGAMPSISSAPDSRVGRSAARKPRE